MEGENESLALEIRDLKSAHAESEKRRKAAEAQLSETQAKSSDDVAKIQELSVQNDKHKVGTVNVYIVLCSLNRKV